MSSREAIEAVHRFIRTFNAQDHTECAKSLNYPHIRLANGRFSRIESEEQFVEMHIAGERHLADEGWHHTVLKELQVIHEGEDKVHIAITNDRCHDDGTVYKTFETFWIATKIDGKWGIQFRSSYLK